MKKTFVNNLLPFVLSSIILGLVYSSGRLQDYLSLGDFYGIPLYHEAYNYSLRDVHGKKSTLNDHLGSFVLVTFGYTRCTGVCPLNLHRFEKMAQSSKLPEKLKFVFISIDPERDRADDVEQFIKRFEGAPIQGLLSGAHTTLAVAHHYKNDIRMRVPAATSEGDDIQHAGFLYLINPEGSLVMIYTQANVEEDKVLMDMKRLQ